MKYTFAFSALVLFAPIAAMSAAESGPPNIIVILSDDHGWADIGAQHPEIAKRLHTKLNMWMNTLTHPGPPKAFGRKKQFIEAGILPGKVAPK
jgi:hypothetical protein